MRRQCRLELSVLILSLSLSLCKLELPILPHETTSSATVPTRAVGANTNTEPVPVQARDVHGQTVAVSANTNTEPVSLCKLEMSMDRMQLSVLTLSLSLCKLEMSMDGL